MGKRLTTFSDEEMQTILAGVEARKNADQIAQTVSGGIHRNTLERRLLKHHGLLLTHELVAKIVPVGPPTKVAEAIRGPLGGD